MGPYRSPRSDFTAQIGPAGRAGDNLSYLLARVSRLCESMAEREFELAFARLSYLVAFRRRRVQREYASTRVHGPAMFNSLAARENTRRNYRLTAANGE